MGQFFPVIGWVGIAALAILNLFAGWLFIKDKRFARKGQRRVPEKTLLILAALGGTPAMIYLRGKIRHKTHKQPFSNLLTIIFFAQVILAMILCWHLWLD